MTDASTTDTSNSDSNRTAARQVEIAVIGAGMVGTACAALLARQGFEVLLLDQHPPPEYDYRALPDLRVSAIAPGNQQMLAGLGAWELITAQRATAYAVMQVCTGQGGQINFTAHEHGLQALGWIVENRLTQWALWQSLPDNVIKVTGRSVKSLVQRRRAVDLTLDDDSVVSARLLVAADGAKSSIRACCELPLKRRDYAQKALVAVLETAQPNPGIAWQIHLPGGPLAFLPLDQGRSSMVWSLPEDQAAEKLKSSPEALAAELTMLSNARFGRVQVVSQVAGFPLHLQLAESMVQQRVVLVGDAAHQVHPMAGQGVNLGFQDVQELAALLAGNRQLLSDSQASSGLDKLLATYQRRRLSENTLMANGIDQLERLFRSQQGLAALGISLANRLQPLKNMFIRHACAPEIMSKSVLRKP